VQLSAAGAWPPPAAGPARTAERESQVQVAKAGQAVAVQAANAVGTLRTHTESRQHNRARRCSHSVTAGHRPNGRRTTSSLSFGHMPKLKVGPVSNEETHTDTHTHNSLKHTPALCEAAVTLAPRYSENTQRMPVQVGNHFWRTNVICASFSDKRVRFKRQFADQKVASPDCV
jgi:hypothetical protein